MALQNSNGRRIEASKWLHGSCLHGLSRIEMGNRSSWNATGMEGRTFVRITSTEGPSARSYKMCTVYGRVCRIKAARFYFFFWLRSIMYLQHVKKKKLKKNLRNRNTVYICSFIFFFSRPNSAGTGLYSDVSWWPSLENISAPSRNETKILWQAETGLINRWQLCRKCSRLPFFFLFDCPGSERALLYSTIRWNTKFRFESFLFC